MAYVYADGQRYIEYIDTVALDQFSPMSIEINKNEYIFKAGNGLVKLPRGCSRRGLGYRLYPYFGGNKTAPHEVKIQFK